MQVLFFQMVWSFITTKSRSCSLQTSYPPLYQRAYRDSNPITNQIGPKKSEPKNGGVIYGYNQRIQFSDLRL
ncbi:MAG: hypothetical protein ACK449_14140 [Planctomycetota bacterium]